MKPRECWTVLANKAQEKVSEAQNKAQKLQETLDKLFASRNRIQVMVEEYTEKSQNLEREMHSVAQSMNSRQFIAQLLQLIQRLDLDIEQAKINLKNARESVKILELERLKMQSLVEQDLKAVNTYLRKEEQKQMDAIGLTLFNVKSSQLKAAQA
jgi:flagellar biosynthesis chaperone FliJ